MVFDAFYTLQIIVTSILGGIVRYLSEFLIKAQTLDKLSWGVLFIHAIIGVFAGYMSFLVASLFTSAEVAGVIASGLGSFGGYGTLVWLLNQAKKKLVLIDKNHYDEVMEIERK